MGIKQLYNEEFSESNELIDTLDKTKVIDLMPYIFQREIELVEQIGYYCDCEDCLTKSMSQTDCQVIYVDFVNKRKIA